MNQSFSDEQRAAFRDWLRAQLRTGDFYTRRGNHYLVREFAKYCVERGEQLGRDLAIDEASLGRYLRDEDPVMPTPDRCRTLGLVLDVPTIDVLLKAGHVTEEDLAHIHGKATPVATKARAVSASGASGTVALSTAKR